MKEFAAMTGLPQSKIRFYEKQGLLLSDRQENGYRVFSPEDAFRANAFRVLLQYGFSIGEAVDMLDAKQGTQEFESSLLDQQASLRSDAELIAYRLKKLEKALDLINSDQALGFALVDMPDQLYINASHGRDFSISLENEKTIAEYYELLSITSCARIIKRESLLDGVSAIDPDYVVTMDEHEKHRLSPTALEQAEHLCLGACVQFRRQATRTESVRREAFASLFEYLEAHKYELSGDIILFPSFLNLDGKGSDIETLYVPVGNVNA